MPCYGRTCANKKGEIRTQVAASSIAKASKGCRKHPSMSGFNGGKLIKGRKRHIIVDTMGCLLVVWVHTTNIFDGKAARQIFAHLFVLLQSIKLIWADCGYTLRELFEWVLNEFNCTLEIVKKHKKRRVFMYCHVVGS